MTDEPTSPPAEPSAELSRAQRLYRNQSNVDFPRTWPLSVRIAAGLVVVSVLLLIFRGLNLGIEFEGGAAWEVPTESVSVADARAVMAEYGFADARIQTGDDSLRVRAEIEVGDERVGEISTALAELAGVDDDDITTTVVGPSWGEEITNKAAEALVVFFIVVSVYISLRLQWRMAVGALAAVAHDIVLTVGIYSLFHFSVTPATVIAFLTIMGYSLYDTLVVFDRAKENEQRFVSAGKHRYRDIMNLSLNQVMMRSVNTTITSMIPVLSVLVVGSWILGGATLSEFAIALMIGLLTGAASSMFIAAPITVWITERDPRWREIRERVDRRAGEATLDRAAIAAAATPAANRPATSGKSGGATGGRVPSGAIPPRPRKQKRR